MFNEDTIIALSTPQGQGAIALIRLSGKKALEVTLELFTQKKEKKIEANKVTFGSFLDANNTIIDEVLLTFFKNPASYTGEDVVEITCHGSTYIIQQIISSYINKGIRYAEPGEFTQRAFLNGKLDLCQAEAVSDLISSENKASHEIALNQMRGGITTELKKVREELIHFTALIELELDFSEEDVEFADRKKLLSLIKDLKSKIQTLISTFEYGNAIKNGVPVAIVGKPNAGKSTLLNVMLNENRAIVSNIAGTTRDTIEENITIEGISFRFIDTAGLRKSIDEVEIIGIQRSVEKMEQAKLIIYVFDSKENTPENILNEIHKWNLIPEKTFILANKCETLTLNKRNRFKSALKFHHFKYLEFISTKNENKNTFQTVKKTLLSMLNLNSAIFNSIIISNTRHFEALQKTLLSINEIENGLHTKLPGDLLSFHLRESLKQLGSITGNIDIDEDILGTIFGEFCIGK